MGEIYESDFRCFKDRRMTVVLRLELLMHGLFVDVVIAHE